jgi:hypothetical protein
MVHPAVNACGARFQYELLLIATISMCLPMLCMPQEFAEARRLAALGNAPPCVYSKVRADLNVQ